MKELGQCIQRSIVELERERPSERSHCAFIYSTWRWLIMQKAIYCQILDQREREREREREGPGVTEERKERKRERDCESQTHLQQLLYSREMGSFLQKFFLSLSLSRSSVQLFAVWVPCKQFIHLLIHQLLHSYSRVTLDTEAAVSGFLWSITENLYTYFIYGEEVSSSAFLSAQLFTLSNITPMVIGTH